MRRFMNVAMESFNGDPLGNENISMEEEAIMLDEAGQSAAEVAQDLNEAEHVVQVSDALEDLAVVAGSKEELSPQEAAAMETAGQMAVAGTDVDPDEIVPAMESFKDADGKISGKLAMESFRETARNIWENIKRILKEIWSKIESFFYKIFGTIPRKRKALKALLERVEDTGRKTKDKAKFTVAPTRYMETGGKVIKTEAELASGLKEVLASAKFVYGGYVTVIKHDGEAIAKALEDFDAEKPQDATDGLVSALKGSKGPALPGASSAGGSRWPKYDVKKGHDLLGGMSLFALEVKNSAGTEGLAFLDHARQAQLELAPSQEKDKANHSSVEFQTIGTAEAESMIKVLEELLDEMESYQRGKAKGEIQKTKSKIETASNKAESAAGKLKEAEDANERAAVPHYRALINFNLAYARWVQQPTVPFTKLAFGVINQAMSLIERSLTQYK
jgi:hypothetical protein